MSNTSHIELINQSRKNQATTKACVDQKAPKPVWHFAFRKLTGDTNMFYLLAATVPACGSAYGGRDDKMLDCLVFNKIL
jgi:hypothetical protein